MKFRIEKDSLGEVRVPQKALWGAQTQRALDNFTISGIKFAFPFGRSFIEALGLIKYSAAAANNKLKLLPSNKATAIKSAAKDVLNGLHDDSFPLDVFQTGSGTSTNMNANEVIANLASKRSKLKINANDDVNMSQSSNDVIPTAICVSALIDMHRLLLPNLDHLIKVIDIKMKQVKGNVKTGRTHLMDATPITLGQEFSGYVSQIDHGINTIENAIDHLSELPIGGTAVGTGLNAPKGYSSKIVEYISINSEMSFKESLNKFEGIATHDSIVEMHGAIKTVAASVYKISNDIRLMGSGPRSGLGELILPANEPGSSIMPGKVNPTQCEAISMVCAQIIGNDVAVSFAGANGHFELNVFKPLFAFNIIESSKLLGDASLSFTENCIDGIKPNNKKIEEFLNDSLMLVTALNSKIGYYKAADIANKAYKEDISLKEAALKLAYLTEDEFDQYVNPERMTNNEG